MDNKAAERTRGCETGARGDIADQIERELREERDRWDDDLCDAQMDKTCVMAGFLDHIAECETALGKRKKRVEELGRHINDLTRENAELRKRAMPEGMEWLVDAWPRFKDDAPVRLLDYFERYGEENGVSAVTVYADGSFALNFLAYSKGERVNRPAPKVLDADGVEIRVGETVYLLPGDWCDKFPCLGYHGDEEMAVFSLHANHVEGGIGCRDTRRLKGTCYPQPSQLTHRAPVLAADGRPLLEKNIVFDKDTGEKMGVDAVNAGVITCRRLEHGGAVVYCNPRSLTHERPVLAADGRPLREGETVWDEQTGSAATVKGFDRMLGEPCAVIDFAGIEQRVRGKLLTHERPVADTWERLEEDADRTASLFDAFDSDASADIRDLVRRAKALAERERGE